MKKILVLSLLSALLVAEETPRDRTMLFGSSGGNVGDRSLLFCCSGTLGALLQDTNGKKYILSNNHVVGISGNATPGQEITQPGLIDNGCQPATTVANFTYAVPFVPGLFASNPVDAAIAELVSGTMSEDGEIFNIGTISSTVLEPSIGLGVQKNGRTTFLTTGTIGAIETTVRVAFPIRCGAIRFNLVRFTNQIVIDQGDFSAGGDSGSLIVSNDASKQPVGLLFAGSPTATIANPAGTVLSALSAGIGSELSFVGAPAAPASISVGPSAGELARVRRVRQARERELFQNDGVLGVGIGAADGRPTEAVLVVYTDRTKRVDLPAFFDGVRVKRVPTDAFVSFAGCCEGCQK
jgi:hypothetical protein